MKDDTEPGIDLKEYIKLILSNENDINWDHYYLVDKPRLSEKAEKTHLPLCQCQDCVQFGVQLHDD